MGLCALGLMGVLSGCARGGPESEEVDAPAAGGTTVHEYAHLEDEVAHLLDFLQGKVPLRADLLSDSVTLYLAEEGGGAEQSLAREDLRSSSAWRVGDYAFAPPEGYGHRMLTPGRHWTCMPVALESRRSGLAHLPHVGVRLSRDADSPCLQTWNATFVFDDDVESPRLTGVVYDQWEW